MTLREHSKTAGMTSKKQPDAFSAMVGNASASMHTISLAL
jgi:hypothetical protein